LPLFAVVVALFWWRGPSFSGIVDAFAAVEWQWVVVAIALNLLSVVFRALAWRTVINQAMPAHHPGAPLVFSAFSVGLFANAELPPPLGHLLAVCFPLAGCTCQLFAVYTAMLAFDLRAPVGAPRLVRLLMNLATICPLWPRNVGLVQAAIATPLVAYGVPYAH